MGELTLDGFQTCTAVSRSPCVNWAFLFFHAVIFFALDRGAAGASYVRSRLDLTLTV